MHAPAAVLCGAPLVCPAHFLSWLFSSWGLSRRVFSGSEFLVIPPPPPPLSCELGWGQGRGRKPHWAPLGAGVCPVVRLTLLPQLSSLLTNLPLIPSFQQAAQYLRLKNLNWGRKSTWILVLHLAVFLFFFLIAFLSLYLSINITHHMESSCRNCKVINLQRLFSNCSFFPDTQGRCPRFYVFA